MLFEKENKNVLQIEELKSLYLRIKDYEFEGGSAPKEMYDEFLRVIKSCEYEEELISMKRNQLLNNFETVCNDMFVKYFGLRGRANVYDEEQLAQIVKKSALRSNELKMDLRDLPRQMLTDENMEEMLKKVAKEKPSNPILDFREPLALVSNKQGETLQDKSLIVTGIRKNIEQYGMRDGLKVANASLLPKSFLQ